jgi:hypothetical protein
MSISVFLETKAANAPAFDPVICFRGRVLIFDLQLDRQPDECFFPRYGPQENLSVVLFFELTSGASYGWREHR